MTTDERSQPTLEPEPPAAATAAGPDGISIEARPVSADGSSPGSGASAGAATEGAAGSEEPVELRPAPAHEPVSVASLRRRSDLSALGFMTTDDLPDSDEIVGQERAIDAVRFSVGMRAEGYNLYALGPSGTGKQSLIRGILERRAVGEATPADWCYVHNFADPQRPRALSLPAGRGTRFREDLVHLTLELRSSIPAAFEAEGYRRRKDGLEETLKRRREEALGAFEHRARPLDVALVRTPIGVGLGPMKGGEALSREEFDKLPPAEQARLKGQVELLEEDLQEVFRQFAAWEREAREQLRNLNRETTRAAVYHPVEEMRRRYLDLQPVVAHLDALEADVVENAQDFIAAAGDGQEDQGKLSRALHQMTAEAPIVRRYQANLIVDNSRTKGAPVTLEDLPNQPNLVGRVEHSAQMGALVTDFTLIRPGALHLANGGYLVLEARKLFSQPNAWEELKRCLRARSITIESLGQALALISTVSLEPEPIPLDVKVVLVGEREIYYLLCAVDPDFLELFKVQADFNEEIDRTPGSDAQIARLIAAFVRREKLHPLDREAVERAIEQLSRIAEHAERVSVHMRSLVDLIREADHWAVEAGRSVIRREDVDRAIDARWLRASRIYERLQEEMERGTITVETSGSQAGQVNGLSVLELGGEAFGHPSRITASIRLGRGELVDIEREVELGGPIHSKGILTLSAFIGSRFGFDRPLALQASIAFEQTYGAVEGDSASLAELCALLSAIGRVPIRQGIAVTGSVDQMGNVQAVGGVNEKIEGFFDLLRRRDALGAGTGADGDEVPGIVLPATNVVHLMLRPDIVAAAADGRFRVFGVKTVDEALQVLTGVEAGERNADGLYPPETLNGRIELQLATFVELAREYASPANPEELGMTESTTS